MADISPAHTHFKPDVHTRKKKGFFALNSSSLMDITILTFTQAKNSGLHLTALLYSQLVVKSY